MTLRINEIHRVLKPTGSLYLHCDPTASHYLKIVLDAIFCGQGGEFLNEIAWCYRQGGRSNNNFGKKHDTIFMYTKSKEWTFNADDVRVPYEGTGGYQNSGKGVTIKGKTYKPNELGKIPENWWDIPAITPMSKERLGYLTQKPEKLLERIIKASSNDDSVILDAFCGCGTTVAVAQKLNRKWIGIDISYRSISLIIKRLTDSYGSDIMNSITVGGIPQDMDAAIELANKKDDRLRKEFEKWTILTYSENKAMINDKKGKDYGIDGAIRVQERDGQFADALFSVKSGAVSSSVIRDFRGVIERDEAAFGVFITLKEPTKDMKQEAALAGTYSNGLMGEFPRIKIVTVQDILNGETLNIPVAADVTKKAKESVIESNVQLGLV
ncbi:MAG: restriction endonuclease [Oscillospiraceae bacterium]|nr:restriction endonuclease [Oscillospiraceae bacterium]